MQCHGDKAEETEERAEKGDSTLTDDKVNVVVEEGGSKIADNGDDEERRHDGMVDTVVRFDLEKHGFGQPVQVRKRELEVMDSRRGSKPMNQLVNQI